MSLLDTFEITANFWELNPQFMAAGATKALYTSDKSRNKVNSSKLMWTIALIWDRGSKYFNTPEDGPDGKIALLFDDYYGDASYFEKNKEKVLKLKEFYLGLQETAAQKTLRGLEKKLEERDKFMQETEYTMGDRGERGYIFGTVDTLDKMMANTKKIYDQYDECRKIVLQEQDSETTKGGGSQSLTDEGHI